MFEYNSLNNLSNVTFDCNKANEDGGGIYIDTKNLIKLF